MATSGYFETNVAPIEGSSSIDPKSVGTDWSAVFDDSTLKWTVTWSSKAKGNASYPSRWTTIQNGTTSFTSSNTLTPASPSATMSGPKNAKHNQELLNGRFDIAIDDNGDASFTGSMTFHVNSTGSSGLCTATQAFTLDQKPQASKIATSVSSITVSSTSTSLGYTVTPTKSGYYHVLRFGRTESSATSVTIGTISTSSYSGSLNGTQLLTAFASASSGTLYLWLDTYKSSTVSEANRVGTARIASVSVTITTANFKPSISTMNNISVYQAGTNISGYLVAGYSSAQIASIAATAGTGTSVSRIDYVITPGSGSTTTGSISGSSGYIRTSVLPAASSNYTLTITATAYDARGQASTAVSKTITVYGYSTPVITANIYRTESSTSTTRDDAGEYVYISYSAVVGASVNSQNTIQSTTCQGSGSVSSSYSSGTHISFAETANATFTVTATDKVSSSTYSVIVYPARYALELYDDKQGNLYAKTSGQLISTKANGDGTNAAILAKSATNAAITAFNETNNHYIELVDGSSGKRGLYTGDQAWILYLNTAGSLQIEKSIDAYASASFGSTSATTEQTIMCRSQKGLIYFTNNGSTGIKGIWVRNSSNSYACIAQVDDNNVVTWYGSAIGIDKGGTGATTAKEARNNLNMISDLLSSSVGSTEVTVTSTLSGYSAFIVTGVPSSNYTASCFIPKAALSTTATKWQVADNDNYIGLDVRTSSDTLLVKVSASSISGKTVKVYGLRGA